MTIPRMMVFATLLMSAGAGISGAVPTNLTAKAIYSPRPEYPTVARLYHMSGGGVFILRVEIRTGLVKDVQIERSTGWTILDYTAKRALKQWRFEPGASNLPPIKVQLPQLKDPFTTEDSFVRVPIHFVEFGGRTGFRSQHTNEKVI